MREIIPDIDRWRAQGQQIALATVIQTWGSAPRGVGAKMAFTPDSQIAASVSGGCVEGAVIEAGSEVLETGRPQLLHFGVADDIAWQVGLACGGTIEVFLERLDTEWYEAYRAALLEERPVAAVTVVRGPADQLGRKLIVEDDGRASGYLGGLDETAIELARAALISETLRRVMLDGEMEVFVEVALPLPQLVIVGGAHIAFALTNIAKTLGYRTVVIDPRRAFASESRFPQVDRLICAWPDEAFGQINLTRATAVVMLTHDPKIDDPALRIALPGPAFYVGALGSNKTQAARRQRLLKAGLSEAQIARLRGPVGLNINARTPEEIALAVMAEIVAVRNAMPGFQKAA